MKIAILGAGKMGSLVGTLASRGGADVSLIDTWKEHVDEINKNGLTLSVNDDEPCNLKIRAYTSAADIGEKVDLLIVLVMGMYTEDAVSAAKCICDENTYCFTLQNGMGNVETLKKYFPDERILYGIISAGGSVLGPGKIHALVDTDAHAHFGSAFYEEPNEFMKEFVHLMQGQGIEFVAVKKSEIDGEIWLKLAKNASSNGVCGLVRLPLGPFGECPTGMEVKKALYYETLAVAKAKGVVVPNEGDGLIIPKSSKRYCHLSSSAQDVKNKRKTEIDFISGYIAREGERLGVSTPYNMVVTKLVKIVEQTYDQQF